MLGARDGVMNIAGKLSYGTESAPPSCSLVKKKCALGALPGYAPSGSIDERDTTYVLRLYSLIKDEMHYYFSKIQVSPERI